MSEDGRLNMAKEVFAKRIQFGLRHANNDIINPDKQNEWLSKSNAAISLEQLLGIEGQRLNWLYSQYAAHHDVNQFTRIHSATDPDAPDPLMRVNAYLSHGNSLAYGIASAAMWHLGLSPAYPLVHGLTRNGGLIFDVADLIKDTTVLPWAFECYELCMTSAMHELRFRIKQQKGDVFIMDTLTQVGRSKDT